MTGRLARAAARAIRATTAVDSAYRRFDSLRSALIARFASDAVLEAFNDLTYGASAVYRPEAPNYRSELFNWEAEVVSRVFPSAPGKVLVGGAGGGREAFALASRGYEVVAFEPSVELARSMAAHARGTSGVLALAGRYEDLPALRAVDEERGAVDLRRAAPFAAALFGWTSYSHIRHRHARVAALREMAALTDGPLVISFYLARRAAPRAGHSSVRRLARRLGFGGPDQFTTHVGFYHLSTPEELRAEVRDADLAVAHECYDNSDGRWPYIVVRRQPPSSLG